MTSGSQPRDLNLGSFMAWAASKTDDEFRAMTHRGALSRKEIADECGFGRSALDQNPRINKALRDLEENLRARGVLPPTVDRDPEAPPEPLIREPGRLRAAQETERLRRLEQENAGLKAEVAELKRAIEKFTVLREALALTGRVPR